MEIRVTHKRFLLPLAVFLLAFSGSSFAQKQGSSLLNAIEKHDVGIFGGGATYLGDFNEKDLLYRLKPIVGVMYRYNFNPYFALRGQAGYTRIEGSSKDYYGDLPGFPTGGSMKFNRSMVMIDGVFELNFLPFSPTDKRHQKIFSPYLALGVGVNFMGTNSYNNNPQLDIAANTYPELYGEPGKAFPQSFVLEIPVGFGVKVSPVKRLTIAGEWTFKKMFYDDIDGFTNRGGGSFNLINDDWVSTITVSLTYRFASNWKCDAYRGGSSGKLLKGLKARTYKVNVQQSAAKDLKKGSNVKMPEGRSENDSNRLKKKKRK